MDNLGKRWMDFDRLSPEYLDGLEAFLNSRCCQSDDGKILCPCKKCVLYYQRNRAEVYEHILADGLMIGFDPSNYLRGSNHPSDACAEQGDGLHRMLHDVFKNVNQDIIVESDEGCSERGIEAEVMGQPVENPNSEIRKFNRLIKEAEEELYPGCKNFSKLSFILQLYNLKCRFRWSNESFNALLKLLKDAFPEGVNLPKSLNETKNIINGLGLKYKKIHACPNDCMLYQKEKINDDVCGRCGLSRWKNSAKKKKKKVPAKVLWHFPLKARLQRLFMSAKTSQLMRWHDQERVKDGVLRHPADSEAWKVFDSHHPEFASDPRNVRLGVATDGFNPFRSMRSSYSTWPVILMPYNLPPWLCMKQSYFMLSLLIPGPRGPGKDIDVYLRPLIEELHDLWEIGLDTYDAFLKETFQMRAAVMWTISDFPAYGNLSGWSTAGPFACPSCNVKTCSKRLTHGKKFCYMGHHRFLEFTHKYRYDTLSFDETIELRQAPRAPTGLEVLDQVKNIESTFGKQGKEVKGVVDKTWKNKSIFFELPYWKDNLLRHNLDVMHIEKNVCDNLVYTLLDIDKKSKDNLSARRDLQEMNIRPKLWPQQRGEGRIYLPHACFTLAPQEKKAFYAVLENAKFPEGYASNISRCVRKERKLSGLKSHDCHVLMQILLPLALRGNLPENVSIVLIELCSFFQELCATNLRVEELELLEKKVVVTLCHMEKIFPPSFFTIMVHLVVHLAQEAKIAGPVSFRWMYPIERYLSTLKSYVGNRARPEGSIAEGYIAEECLSFCSKYLLDAEENIGVGCEVEQESSIFPTVGQPSGCIKAFMMDEKMWTQAHRYVLFNCVSDGVASFRDQHVAHIKRLHRRRRLKQHDIDRLHSETFHEWFKEQVVGTGSTSDRQCNDDIKVLARGPNYIARRFQAFEMKNGYKFRTKEYERDMVTQNSGVMVIAKTQSYASTSDTRPVFGDLVYYGVLTDIVELNYYDSSKVVLFKCDWVDVARGRGVKKDVQGFTLVNFSHLIHTGDHWSDDPFIFASQAQQVIFVQDYKESQWFVPLPMKPRKMFDMTSICMGLENNLQQENEVMDWVRSDHEGALIDTCSDQRRVVEAGHVGAVMGINKDGSDSEDGGRMDNE